MKHFVLLLSLVFVISCGEDEKALTAANPAEEPTTASEASAPTETPAAAPGAPTEAPPSEPEPTKTRKELGERFGIKFHADEKCAVEDDGDVTLFKFGKQKVVTLHENGLMTAHDAAGKEWLHAENIKELFVLRGNVGFLNKDGLFRYVYVGHTSLVEFYNAKSLVIDNEGFVVYGETKDYTVISGYRWDSASIVINFRNPKAFELKADKLIVTAKNDKVYEYPRTTSPHDLPKKKKK